MPGVVVVVAAAAARLGVTVGVVRRRRLLEEADDEPPGVRSVSEAELNAVFAAVELVRDGFFDDFLALLEEEEALEEAFLMIGAGVDGCFCGGGTFGFVLPPLAPADDGVYEGRWYCGVACSPSPPVAHGAR